VQPVKLRLALGLFLLHTIDLGIYSVQQAACLAVVWLLLLHLAQKLSCLRPLLSFHRLICPAVEVSQLLLFF